MSPNSPSGAPGHGFTHLDMMRGLAAMLVFVSHLRAFVFLSYGELGNVGIVDKAFWAVTGFGHQSVMIFFVLSGFFITRSIIVDDRAGRFTWVAYLIKRLTRLWAVLIPCLIATLIWDRLGIALTGPAYYKGHFYAQYISGPDPALGGADLALRAFAGNLFFLQTILVPVFGSNGPLWSLAYEFWYYLMFPLLYLTVTRTRHPLIGALNLGLFAAICLLIGYTVMLYGLIWLMGSAVCVAYERGWFARWFPPAIAAAASAMVLLAVLGLSRTHYGEGFGNDVAIGLATSALVLGLSRLEITSPLYRRAATSLADASYTIYLAHFPFLALLANVLLANQRFPNSAAGYAVFAGLGIAALAYCCGVYWLFERRTPAVRRFFLARYATFAGKLHRI